jgi:hypothetical protein
MWGFLMGAMASGLALSNKKETTRSVASAIVLGEKVVRSAVGGVTTAYMQISQDVQDIKAEQAHAAELQAEQTESNDRVPEETMAPPQELSQADIEALMEQIATLRDSVAELRANLPEKEPQR